LVFGFHQSSHFCPIFCVFLNGLPRCLISSQDSDIFTLNQQYIVSIVVYFEYFSFLLKK
jgi:hypothetical protein